jgi:hypothetical protein
MPRRTFQAETPLQALLLEQALLLAQQLERTADQAPDGQVLARVETAAVLAGQELTRKAVQAALQAQAQQAEKKGRRADAAPTAANAVGPEATSPEIS